MRIGHGTDAGVTLRLPLICSGGALGQLPFVAKQVVEEVVAPLCRLGGPDDFQAAGDGVAALAGAETVPPAEALFFEAGGFGLTAHIGWRSGAVSLAEGVAARDQRDGFFVVHGHAPEGLADIVGRGDGVGVAVRAFRVHVDQAHLHGGERILQIALFAASAGTIFLGAVQIHIGCDHAFRRLSLAVAMVAAQPGLLGSPIDVFVRLPDVLAAAAETEGLEAHRFQGDVAGEDDQVGPGNFVAILLLDRPDQPARLVEADVVGPTVERSEALLAGSGAAASVTDAVGSGAVPCHANE